MLRVPVNAFKLDIDNEELLDGYDRLVKRSNLKELYFAGDIRGLRELTSSYFFRLIEARDEYNDVYYCDELSMYFMRANNLALLGSREATYIIDDNRLKCRKFLNDCKEITELDKEKTANKQLLLLRQGKVFTR